MNDLQHILNESEYAENDAIEYGYAYAQIGHTEGVSVQFHKDYGWSACQFTPTEDKRTGHYQTRQEAISALFG